MLRIGLKLNKVTENLKTKNPEIRKNPEESHPCMWCDSPASLPDFHPLSRGDVTERLAGKGKTDFLESVGRT